MNKKYCLIGLFCLGLLVLCFLKANVWFIKSNQENTETISTMELLEMTGWHEGGKQWNIKANKIVSQNNIIIFTDVKNGVLFRPDEPDAYFEAAIIEYNETKKQLIFPNGLKLKLDNQQYHLKEGLWDGKGRIFTAKGVALKQDNKLQMNAEQMRYDEQENMASWLGKIKISAKIEPGGDSIITANKLSYHPKQKKWTAGEGIMLELNRPDKVYKISSRQIIFDDMLTNISMPAQLEFIGTDFSGTASSASGTVNSLALQNVSVADNTNNIIITADRALIADDKFAAGGSVIVHHRDKTTYCDEIEMNESSTAYIIKGNIKTVLEKKTTIFAKMMIFDDAKKKTNFEEINILTENGTEISADNGYYTDGEKKFLLEGNVLFLNPDGRRTTADRAVYDSDKKIVSFTGRVKSNSKNNP